MFDNKKILPPPWMALPDIERGSIHWRMGIGEAYLENGCLGTASLANPRRKNICVCFPSLCHGLDVLPMPRNVSIYTRATCM